MKLLLDQNISRRILPSLEEVFPDSTQVQLIGLEYSDDLTIWRYAKEHAYTILTKDADFTELMLLYGVPPKIIWLKCGNIDNSSLLELILQQHDSVSQFIDTEGVGCLELYP